MINNSNEAICSATEWTTSLSDTLFINYTTSDVANRFVAAITSKALVNDLLELKMFLTARIYSLTTGNDVIITPPSELLILPELRQQLTHVDAMVSILRGVPLARCCMMLTEPGYFNRFANCNLYNQFTYT